MLKVEDKSKEEQFQIKLDNFEGPFDLLLHLIEDEKVDIYDVSINKITTGYLTYLHEIQIMDLDISGEFLIMAAALIELKSKLLLPSDGVSDESLLEEARAERLALLEKLVEYKMFKNLASSLSERENFYAKVFNRNKINDQYIKETQGKRNLHIRNASMTDLIKAFDKIWHNLELRAVTRDVDHLALETISVKEKKVTITDKLKESNSFMFSELFKQVFRKNEVIATFLAILELVRQQYIGMFQNDIFDDIEIRSGSNDLSQPVEFDDTEYNTIIEFSEE